MKSTLTLALALLSLSAIAGRITVNSSWAEIEASRQHITVKPMELNPVGGLFNACLDADGLTLRSINNIKFCDEGHEQRVGSGDNVTWEWVCDRYKSWPASTPRITKKRECIEFVTESENVYCRKYADKEFLIPVKYLIEVQEQGGEQGYRTVFKKPFTIPSCN
ncbi:MAG: hypothetical protein K2P81_00310 [Bacteriovoracaceae bacterium]|nr:hypothetical protein [Bacteriovoracaceae bacterium]